MAVCAYAEIGSAQERWSTYTNPRFGTTADYPTNVFTVRDPPPVNGDGQTFRNRDGRAKLSIYGKRNVELDTPRTYVEKYPDLRDTNYQRVTRDFFVVSRARKGIILYDRCNFPRNRDGIIDCISLTYPAEEREAWDSVVSRVSRSLRTGRGIEPR